MKNIIIIIVFSIFISSCFLDTIMECPYDPYVLKKQEALGEIKAKTYFRHEARKGHERTFYIVEPEMLKRARDPGHLKYLGSIENYHLLNTVAKCYSEDEIYFFAVNKKYCDVENERSLKDEIREPDRRRAIIVDGKCVVKERKQVE